MKNFLPIIALIASGCINERVPANHSMVAEAIHEVVDIRANIAGIPTCDNLKGDVMAQAPRYDPTVVNSEEIVLGDGITHVTMREEIGDTRNKIRIFVTQHEEGKLVFDFEIATSCTN